MLKIERLDKKFNKGKKNQIHAINSTSLEMDKTGLVALLGPSGCGKTTLLNVIGGLDSPGNGDVYINGNPITHRLTRTVDKIRNLNIGYIFQNYNLIDDMTVYENVAIALRLTGLKNEKEIEEKVSYVLEQTGMYRYRNRTAQMLSGGERQRVGIARAIVKNPAIILADEPTGNLDSRNTIEIMNIIKTISKDRLVILVTHEEELAKFYATRIIRISDGRVVSDQANTGAKSLDYKLDYKIYLKDIKDHKRIKTDSIFVDFYNESQEKIMLDIVVRDGSIFVRSKDENSRIEIVDKESAVEFVDDHYRHLEDGQVSEKFDLSKLETKAKKKYKSIVGPIRMLKDGFKTIGNYGALKKILLAGFVISAMFVTYSISSIYGTLKITDDMFVTMDKSYLTIASKNTNIDDYKRLEENNNVSYILPGNSLISMPLKYDSYLQTSSAEVYISGSVSDINKLNETNLKYGRLPENDKEIVIDSLAIDEAISNYQTKEIGLGTIKSYLNKKVNVPNMGEFTIVGVSECESPCIYTDHKNFINFIAYLTPEMEYVDGLIDYNLMKSQVNKVKGQWPENTYQVMVNEIMKEDMKIGKTIGVKVNGQKLKVVGYYKAKRENDLLLVSPGTIKYKVIKASSNITVCPIDKAAALSQLRDEGYNVRDSYKKSKAEYIKQHQSYNRATLIVAAIILAISCIEIFIIMRASFMSRVREIGILRAIGIKKGDIYRIFTGEIIAITTLTSLPGFIGAYYIIDRLAATSYFDSMFMTNRMVAITCIAIIYGTNLIFGLLPVLKTIRKKPAEILSRTDVN